MVDVLSIPAHLHHRDAPPGGHLCGFALVICVDVAGRMESGGGGAGGEAVLELSERVQKRKV